MVNEIPFIFSIFDIFIFIALSVLIYVGEKRFPKHARGPSFPLLTYNLQILSWDMHDFSANIALRAYIM